MKNKYLLSIASFCIAALTLVSCNPTPTIIETDYLKLETSTADFIGVGNEPVIITAEVNNNNKITAKSAETEPWIKVSNVTSNTFTVNVDDNDTGIYRSGIITITAGDVTQQFTVHQTMEDNEFCKFRKLRGEDDAVSVTGKYVGSARPISTEDGSYAWIIEYIDTATDKIVAFDPITNNLLPLIGVTAVSDTGVVYVELENGKTEKFDFNNMSKTTVAPPAGLTSRPKVSSASLDGTAVGWTQGTPDYRPLIWVNDEPRELPRPEKSFRDGEAWHGPMARGISLDGTIIYGSSWEGFDGGLIWWKNDVLMGYAGGTDVDRGDEIHFISDQQEMIDQYKQFVTNGLTIQGEPNKVSSNGKYIGAQYRVEIETPSKLKPGKYPAFFNTETNKTKVFTDLGEGTGATASDDGIGFINIGSLGVSACYVVNIETGDILGKATEWIKENYDITTPFGGIKYVNADMSVIYGASSVGQIYMQWYVAPPLKK